MRVPKLLDCIVLNPPETSEEQDEYDDLIYETLATALCRCLEPEEINQIIKQLE